MTSHFQLVELLDSLERKVVVLTSLYAEAQQRIGELERENEALQETGREQQTLIKQLQKKVAENAEGFPKSKDFGKIVSDKLTSTVSNAEITQKLDEYIREIDRCIAHLNNLS